MAAVHSRLLPVEPAANDHARRTHATVGRVGATRRIAAALLAVACGVLGLVVARAYPIAPLAVAGAFVAWVVFAALRLPFAFASMLALMPVTGFAVLTGWLTFEELDLFVLATSAGGYAALALRPPPPAGRTERLDRPGLSIFSAALVALFLASTAIALQRGLAAAGPLHFDWLQGYDDPLNSLRIFKPFAWAVLLTPLLLQAVRRPLGLDRFGLGMTAALGLGALAVLQERYAFTDLFDFSSDYRVTAPFWEMHVGGAALDGFLALTIPFAVREVARGAARWRIAGACAVLALASYASLVTFSRGVYAAVPISLLMVTVLLYRQRQRLDRRALWKVLGGAGLFAVVIAAGAFVVFRGGGYRSLLAAFAVLGCALPVGSALRRSAVRVWLAAAIAALLLGAVGYGLSGVIPKGPYVVFALAFAATLACVVRSERAPAGRSSTPLDLCAIACWTWMALAACAVARHWGGPGALRDSAIVVGGLVALSLAVSRTKRPVWPVARRERVAILGFAAFVVASVAVFTAGAYMGNRFSSSEGDLALREAHWRQGIGRLHGSDWLFGKGLGRFPATSQFESPDAAAPGAYRLVRRDGETFVAVSTTRKRYLGFDELFRFSQRVTVRPNTPYVVRVEARSDAQNSLHLEVCEKQLLYHLDCRSGDPQVLARSAAEPQRWQRIEIRFDTGAIGASTWFAPRPVWFAIAAYNPASLLEIRSVEMIGPDGVDVIANGRFANGTAHWFSSSDRWHLPWHIKNIVLDVLFDQGTIGLALFVVLVGAALLRTTLGRAHRHPDAPYVAAALVAYLVVGAFDSLLDVPRVAFVFYLVVLLGLMLRNPRATSGPQVGTAAASREAPPAAPVAPVAAEDAAAARARRRRAAFGTRRPG